MKALVFATSVAAAALLSPVIAQADTVLRLAHSNAVTSPKGTGAEKFAELVGEYTEGRVTVQVFPATQLGSNRKAFTSTRSGAIEMSLTPYSMLADVVPEMSVYVAGYMFENFEEQQKILNHAEFGEAWKESLLERSGLRVLCTYFYGSRNLTTTDTPVKTPADMNGLKIRAVPQPMSMAVIRGLGGTPTPMPISDVFQALGQGVIDGQENPLPTIEGQHFYEAQEYLMMTDHQLIVEPYLINDDVWQSLGEEDQANVQRAADESCALTTELTHKEEASLVEQFKEAGMTVITEAEGLDVPAFRTSVLEEVEQAYDGEIWPEGTIANVRAVLDR